MPEELGGSELALRSPFYREMEDSTAGGGILPVDVDGSPLSAVLVSAQ